MISIFYFTAWLKMGRMDVFNILVETSLFWQYFKTLLIQILSEMDPDVPDQLLNDLSFLPGFIKK